MAAFSIMPPSQRAPCNAARARHVPSVRYVLTFPKVVVMTNPPNTAPEAPANDPVQETVEEQTAPNVEAAPQETTEPAQAPKI